MHITKETSLKDKSHILSFGISPHVKDFQYMFEEIE